jgi:hypothetical protein
MEVPPFLEFEGWRDRAESALAACVAILMTNRTHGGKPPPVDDFGRSDQWRKSLPVRRLTLIDGIDRDIAVTRSTCIAHS